MAEKRPCRRCLLQEAYPQDYEKYIASVLKDMPPGSLAPADVQSARLNVCRQCDQLNNGTCMGCGCLVEIRAAQRKMKCPFEKWPPDPGAAANKR